MALDRSIESTVSVFKDWILVWELEKWWRCKVDIGWVMSDKPSGMTYCSLEDLVGMLKPHTDAGWEIRIDGDADDLDTTMLMLNEAHPDIEEISEPKDVVTIDELTGVEAPKYVPATKKALGSMTVKQLKNI